MTPSSTDAPTTRLIHHPYAAPGGFDAPQPAVHRASTVFFPDVAAVHARDWRQKVGYTYGLHGTPTTFVLEERLATLEGGTRCLLAPSGLAAVSLALLSLLRSGDEVLIPANAYGPTRALAEAELAHWGITHQLYDPMRADDLQARLSPRTALVWLEAPGSVTMEFPDLPALAAAARGRGVTTVLDNTWGAGLAFDPFDLPGFDGGGIDVSVHALTKYPSGGGDVLMGSVVTRDDALHQRLAATHMRLGLGVGANDCELVLRSLPSIALRYAAHDRAARALAGWLATRPEVAQVLHPSLPGSPGHAHWRTVCGHRDRAAGLFSVVFAPQYTASEVHAVCDALRLFRLGYSWGGPVSLVMPYDVPAMRDARVAPWSHAGTLVRFSVGLEDVDDLRSDLAQALATLPARG